MKFQYEKIQEDGTQKKVTEQYVVDALSWGEAEEKITKEMEAYVSGESKIKSIVPASYHEIFFVDDDADDDNMKWYKAKLAFITLDEKTEKEKRTNVFYLVQAKSTEDAQKNVKEAMGGTMIDYDILGINETKIMDVFEHEEGDKAKSPSKSSEPIDEFE